jgi:class 3 adenylate cyclase
VRRTRDNVAVETRDHATSEETSASLAAIIATVGVEYMDEFRGQTSPDGMMTIVFTDVEGSTEMMERLGEETWLGVLRDHNNLMRARVADHNGVVVKSQGDGFMLVFSSASAALACAVELQRMFATYSERHPDRALRVRIGVHTGNTFQEADDFFGHTVVLAARITGRARGGEVLVSEACKQYTERTGMWTFSAPSELSLKGLANVERVHSLEWSRVKL